VAALFDTTVAVLLLRRRPPEEAAGLVRAAEMEIAAGGALLPSVAVSELVIGEKTERGVEKLTEALTRVPTVILSAEAARYAGAMGAFLRSTGAPVPLPDLLIAATAAWLELPLLAWDGDYARSREVATASASSHPGAELWRRLSLHGASLDT
jgi:predicted nucleic acid-binding protein